MRTYSQAGTTSSSGWPVTRNSGSERHSAPSVGTVSAPASTSARWNERATAGWSPAPIACAITASRAMTIPMPTMAIVM